jgi:formylglycine-generating enzyme required for sulfatase activity
MADDSSRTLRASNLDAVCQEFEAAWQRGERPAIEDFVERAGEYDRKALLAELLQLVLDDRRKYREAATIPPSTAVDSSTDEFPRTVTFRPAENLELPVVDGPNEDQQTTGGRIFGDYELIEFISRGGMGAVYKARQTRLNRIVAVKMMLSGQLADAGEVRRFHIEAEAAAGLDHPGIVPVFENGEVEGEHFFSMAYVQGQSLAERLRDGLLPVDASQRELVYDALLAAPPDEANVLIGVLASQKREFIERLWNELLNTAAGARSRLRAAMALATYDSPGASGTNGRWEGAASFIADELLAEARQEPGQYEPLALAFTPLADLLIEPLSAVFRDRARNATERNLATSILASYAQHTPTTLSELAVDADGEQFLKLFPILQSQKNSATRQLFDGLVHTVPAAELSQVERVRLGQRRAAAAIALLRQGERESIFDALRVGDDPESRTQFIHRLRERGVKPAELIECVGCSDSLRRKKTGDARRVEGGILYGLLLALGEFELSDVPEDERERTLARLADWYANDPSSAIHGATGWLLRRWGQEQVARKVDERPVPYSLDREWFTLKIEPHHREAPARPKADENQIQNPIYSTFIVFPPGKYFIGSPDDETDRRDYERRHEVEITRTFALADRELTWAQVNAFDVDVLAFNLHDALEKQFGRTLTAGEPVIGVNWFDAVNYCRWLTIQAGMSDSDQCYADPTSLQKDSEGHPKNWTLDLSRRGFRLPTEAEWEVACRGVTMAAWSFGNDVQLFSHYGWFSDNSAKWSHAVGQMRPDPRGVFDLHGNVWECCHDWYESYQDEVVDPLGPLTGAARVARGGGADDRAAACRSAVRGGLPPAARSEYYGFRVALSCVQPN